MKVLVFDPVGGASGDMILGSLIDLGCPVDYLQGIYDKLGVDGYRVSTTRKKISGIAALDLHFTLVPEKKDRDHARIVRLIGKAKIPEGIRVKSLAAFAALAEAEARVHGEDAHHIHFHELGALDSILDIVGIAAAIEWFHAEKVYSRPLPMGTGTVKCRHGIIPIPAPATTVLLEGVKVRWPEVEGELTTPTAAAVFKTMTTPGEPPEIVLTGSGYSCGDNKYGAWPNIFRVMRGDVAGEGRERIYVLECDVDDMIPEDWEVARQRLFDLGALDVVLTPQIMKRGRPGVNLRVLAGEELLAVLGEAVFNHTTTIGLRRYPVERIVLPRGNTKVATAYGEVSFKEVRTPGGRKRAKPEFKELEQIALREKKALPRLRRELAAASDRQDKKEKQKKS